MSLAGANCTPLAVSLVSDLVFPNDASMLLIAPGPAVNQPIRNATVQTTTARIVQLRRRRRICCGPFPVPTPRRWSIPSHDLALRSVGADVGARVWVPTNVDAAFGTDIDACARPRVIRSGFAGWGRRL